MEGKPSTNTLPDLDLTLNSIGVSGLAQTRPSLLLPLSPTTWRQRAGPEADILQRAWHGGSRSRCFHGHAQCPTDGVNRDFLCPDGLRLEVVHQFVTAV
ncbi:hypothetical protein BaRGS_00007029 [Batillaria attramentaria]|uniref:Uncharacterized protein n=1 Tax=Batillaria attramentaria TaxID=370345 RepID=A0ABD0LBW2_9CAEN